ncbi:MAG: membrane protein insertion efficiency factor YidD [Planctomycetota bacterium]|nr:membrane protein insertion efficiency factor YidD [Planctomycetota bacterium]
MSRLRALATAPLRFYRRYLSPWKPPMCRFAPTCSQYAIEAVEAHGILRGGALAIWRILRCQPFARPGYDPVPPRRGHDGCAHDHDRHP